MIAYLILVHRYPEQFKRLFRAIHSPGSHYLVHVDLRSGAALLAEIEDFLKEFPNASLLKSEKALWGGYSLVDAELRGIEALLKINPEWEFFINLSGQDFPLQSQASIEEFLAHNSGRDFMKLAKQADMRPETMHRIENVVTELGDEIVSEPVVKRSFLEGVTPYIGNQWMILSRRFCEFVSSSPEVDRFKDFYRNTLIADEGFFQTVIMNTSYQADLVNDDKRAIDWVPMESIKLRPRDWLIDDAAFLMASSDLFARKFDDQVDAEIFAVLERHISRHGNPSGRFMAKLLAPLALETESASEVEQVALPMPV